MRRWMDDAESNSCLRCLQEFSLFNRKHHCRRCGELVCQACSTNEMMIPIEDLLSPPFSLILSDHTVPHRCCDKCHQDVLKRQTRATSPNDVRPQQSPVIDVVELKVGQPSKKYALTVPFDLSPTRQFQVLVEGRMVTVQLTPDINAGDRIIVRAPVPSGVAVASAVAVAPITKKEGTVPCLRCTFDNPSSFVKCQICGEGLDSSRQTTRHSLVTVDALEVCPGDSTKNYYVVIPNNTRVNDTFQVLLDYNLWTVICPAGADEGDRIIVRAIDPGVMLGRYKASIESTQLANPSPERSDPVPAVNIPISSPALSSINAIEALSRSFDISSDDGSPSDNLDLGNCGAGAADFGADEDEEFKLEDTALVLGNEKKREVKIIDSSFEKTPKHVNNSTVTGGELFSHSVQQIKHTANAVVIVTPPDES